MDNELFVNTLTIALGDKVGCSLKELQDVINSVASDYCVTKLQTTLPSTTDGSTTLYLCKKFSEYKIAKGMGEKTLKQYIYAIRGLCNQIGKEVSLITTDDIIKYLDYYRFNGNNSQHKPVSDRAVQNKYLLFSSFFSFLTKQKYIAENPMDLVEMPKASESIKTPLSVSEKERIVIACNDINKHCKRQGREERAIALITFALESCCRVDELCKLNIEDINFQNHTAIIYNGKGKKGRTVVFGDKSAVRLNEYLRTRGDFVLGQTNTPLFASLDKTHHRLASDAIRNIVKNVAHKSGVSRIHPHLFRTTGATDLLKNGVPLTVVAEQLGHKSIETTNIYTKIDLSTSRNMILKNYS